MKLRLVYEYRIRIVSNDPLSICTFVNKYPICIIENKKTIFLHLVTVLR